MAVKRPHLRYKNQTPRERTWTIHFIALEKAIKGTLLIIVAAKLLSLFGRDVHAWAEELVSRHGIDLANRYVAAALDRLVGMSDRQLITFSVIGFVYAGLLFTEGIGLWLQKRWAEYMTAFLTALFIPVELYEIYEKFTWVRVGILGLNVFVVWYLVTRLNDEKGHMTHDTKHLDAPHHDTTYDGYEVKIKICGITNVEDARHAIDAGADQLGLNFYPESPRYVSPDTAREIVRALPKGTQTVGIFVNEPINDLLKTASRVGIKSIQLHGDEDFSYVFDLRKKTKLDIIKAFRVSPDFDVVDALDWNVTFPLFDSYSPNERGGTGKAINWKEIATDIYLWFPRAAYLAGGLTPENVAEAVRTVKPYMVDVASGVESSPGKKDPEKVVAFIKAAKEAL